MNRVSNLDWTVVVIIFLVFGVFLIVGIPYWYVTNYSGVDYSSTGQIGDTVGGISGPFISLIGSVLLFITIILQVKANENFKISSREDSINKDLIVIESYDRKSVIDDAYNMSKILDNLHGQFRGADAYGLVKIYCDKYVFIILKIMVVNKKIDNVPNWFEFSEILEHSYFYIFKDGFDQMYKSLERHLKVEDPYIGIDQNFVLHASPLHLFYSRLKWAERRFSTKHRSFDSL